MIVKEYILEHGNGTWGEDRIHLGETVFCVVDGATPISKQAFMGYHSSAEWLADGLCRHFGNNPLGCNDIPRLCRAFVDQTLDTIRLALPKVWDYPSATMAAVCCDGNTLQGYLLGDCSIYVLYRNGRVEHITDQRAQTFYMRTVAAKHRAQAEGKDPVEAARQQQKKNKESMNQPDGYWTVSYLGKFEEEYSSFQCAEAEVEAILLCSDGFDRMFSLGLTAPMDLLTQKYSLKKALSELRDMEQSIDQDVKKHDDASAILLLGTHSGSGTS